FMSQAGVKNGVPEQLGLQRPVFGVKNCREISKADLKLNTETPHIEVNPETYEVRADGELLTCEPAEVLPMAQRYFLF
ncbi:MAG: urease subunit alpha, partial [Cyanobacteria bacterium P01_E01_bin.34]